MDSDRVKVIGIFGIIFLVLCGYFYFTQGRENIRQKNLQNQQVVQTSSTNSAQENVIPTETKSGVYYKVHVAGEINNPGVYTLDSKDRLIDAVKAAVGATEAADLDRVNLAEYIKDGEKIRIPNINERNITSDKNLSFGNFSLNENENKIEDILSAATGNYNLDDSTKPKKLININTATVSELEQLPNVGPTIASNIVLYREQNGNFESIEQLKEVKRIGNKTFEKLKDFVTVN